MSFTFRISNSRLITLNVPPFASTPYQQTDNPLKQKSPPSSELLFLYLTKSRSDD